MSLAATAPVATAPAATTTVRPTVGLTPTHVLLLIAVAVVLVALATAVWGLPALVMIALPVVPLMCLWFFIISLP